MKKFLVLAAAAIMMASCCNNKAVELAGKWTISTVNGEEVSLEKMPFIEFDTTAGKFHGNAGVNLMNGEFTQEGKKLTFGEAATTMMAGQDAETAVERSILKNIEKVAAADKAEENVELKDAEGNVLFVLSR